MSTIVKKERKSSKKVKVEEPEVEICEITIDADLVKKHKKGKKEKKEKKIVEEVVEEVPVVVEEVPVVVEEVPVVVEKTGVESVGDVVAELLSVVASLKEHVVVAKGKKDKELASSLLGLAKQLQSLKKPIEKLPKQKKVKRVINSENTGFKKPIKISEELSKFCGWPIGENHSRVDVTRAVCSYIKEKELQNPENKREILADKHLKSLLKYDAKKEGKGLTYYMIQSHIQHHFIKV